MLFITKRRRRKHKTYVLAIAGVLAITIAALCTLWLDAKPNEAPRSTGTEKADDASRKRPAYPYSVVPGGVYSAEEFSHAAARDSVVAAHYLVINGSRLRATNLESSRSAYVSYRMNDAIYWTKQTVKLPKGERVLSDGESLIRARCGNRISAFPRLPVLSQEPAEVAADQVGSLGQEPVPGKLGIPSFEPMFPLPAPSIVSAPDPSSGRSLPEIMPTGTGGGSTPPIGGGGTTSTGGGGTSSTGGGGTPSTGGGGTSPTGGGGTTLSGGTGKPPSPGGTTSGAGSTLPVSGTGRPPIENKSTSPDPSDPSTPDPPGGDSGPRGPADNPSYAPVTPVVNVIPEPSSWILLGSVALWLAGTLRNRRRH